MARTLIAVFILMLTPLTASASGQPGFDYSKIDLSKEAVKRGKDVFMAHCVACHGLKYHRTEEHREGIPPMLDPGSAKASFGVEPPDLSLMAVARGKRLNGVAYIYRLLTTYYTDPAGAVKNRAFAEETQGDGTIAMPQPIPSDDPDMERKSMDVAVFLLDVAEPTMGERHRIGYYVLAYMVVLTGVLWALNKYTWKGVKKKLDL